jgi:hypothetical protein
LGGGYFLLGRIFGWGRFFGLGDFLSWGDFLGWQDFLDRKGRFLGLGDFLGPKIFGIRGGTLGMSFLRKPMKSNLIVEPFLSVSNHLNFFWYCYIPYFV